MKDNLAGTLIFDGDCGFCTTAANFAEGKSKTPIHAVPWQRAHLANFGLTEEQASRRVYFVDNTGSVFGGHRAFAALLRVQPQLGYKVLGSLIILPPISWIAAVAYVLVAKYRHKLPGGTPACKLP